VLSGSGAEGAPALSAEVAPKGIRRHPLTGDIWYVEPYFGVTRRLTGIS
jgi:hypothetical protein